MDLTDAQWNAVAPLLPPLKVRRDRRGRPWRDPRDVLNGVLWILRTGAPWADMPDRYPSYATCFRRFQSWVKHGVLERILQALADDLFERGKLDLSETFIDGTHAGAKKGDHVWAELVEALPPRSWQSQIATVFLYLPPSLRVNATKFVSSRPRSKRGSRSRPRPDSLETALMTALGLRKRLPTKGSS